MEKKEKYKDVTEEIISLQENKPVKNPVGRPKKHSGHAYKKDCPCAMCSKITAKEIREGANKDEIISSYIDSLPEDVRQVIILGHVPDKIERETVIAEFVSSLLSQNKMIVLFSEDTQKAIANNNEKVKAIFGEYNEASFNQLINQAIIKFCNSL